jgi:thioredoxin reductase (NADPH)
MKKIILFIILNFFYLKTSQQLKPLMSSILKQVMNDVENKLSASGDKTNLNKEKNILKTNSPETTEGYSVTTASSDDDVDQGNAPVENLTKNQTPSIDDGKIIIIGSGPAGCAAAIYLARSNFQTLVINGQTTNSQLIWADKIENYLGVSQANGENLLNEFQQQAKAAGAEFVNGDVIEVDFSNRPYKITLSDGQILYSNYILIATGSKPKDLNVPGEHEYRGKGIGVCAHCDGPLCENKETVIIGGNYDMLRELNILAKHTNKITIITKESDFKNIPSYFTRNLCKTIKPKILFNHVVQEIVGDGKKANGVRVYDSKKRKTKIIDSECIFITIGYTPSSQLFKKYLKMDYKNRIIVDCDGRTNLDGVFAAGDVTDRSKHQIITNAGDGYKVSMAVDAEIQRAKDLTDLDTAYECPN